MLYYVMFQLMFAVNLCSKSINWSIYSVREMMYVLFQLRIIQNIVLNVEYLHEISSSSLPTI